MAKPKVALALGSGGARGFAHIGVIKVLEEEGIPIDLIAGSSMGGLIGALFASGLGTDHLYKIATAFRRKYYLDFTVPKMGFISGDKVKELIRIFTKGQNIEDLPLPIAIVTTDLERGEKVIFTKGPVSDAVRASISIPGIFVPEKIGGRLLVDGGVVDRVPISVAKEMGADIVIAVDVSHYKANVDISSIFDVIMQSIDIMQDELVRFAELNADVMIKPKADQYSGRAFTNISEIIEIGEQAAKVLIPQIKATIKKWEEAHDEQA